MLARQIVIGFGIAVILPLLVYYSVSTFYPIPKTPNDGTTECMMLAVTPEQRVECWRKQRTMLDARDAENKEFSWRLVAVGTPLGVSAILIGAYLSIYEVGTGLILGGILTVTFGFWSHWQYIESWARLVSLLVGFVILLFLGYRGAARIHSRSHGP
jgi:uncharacterized membrane protein YphA (DoxX/SURF4 family)